MTPSTPAQRDALFAAILVNDVVDAAVDLPAVIRIDYPAGQLRDGFAISRDLWAEGFDRHALIAMTTTLRREGALDVAAQLRFKHIRAKFKHLRFAFVLYGAEHRCPPAFKAVTTAMGHLQDAFRGGRRAAASRYALVLRGLLTPLPLTLARREVARVRLSEPAGFRAFTLAQIATLRGWLEDDTMTGHRFHVARKIVSRQVSFHDDMRVLQSAPEHHQLSRYLSAINGLMGQHHDELVARKARGELDYARDAIALPPDIRRRLTALVARYPG